MAMADNTPSKPKTDESPKAEAPVAEKAPEPRNLTREMLAAELGEAEARKRIP
jgi:hypothetical protein